MKQIPERTSWWLFGALSVGAAGDLLLRATPWGFNLAVWVLMIAGFVLFLLMKERQSLNRGQVFWFVVAILFGMLPAFRDSDELKLFNTAAMLGASGFAFWLAGIGRTNTGGVILTGIRMAGGLFRPLVGAFSFIGEWLVPDTTQKQDGADGWDWKKIFRAAVGLVITLPVLMVFASLFAAADVGFKKMIGNLLDFEMGEFALHILFTGIFTWIAAGIFYWVWPREVKDQPMEVQSPSFLGVIELGILLGALNLLFLLFIGVQVRYLFGGDALVQQTAGLSYAEYFRNGFFELLAVAALVIPLLLFCDWVWKAEENPRRFRQLAVCLLVQLGIVMVSAFRRLALYLEAYGLTEDRIYAAVVLSWLGFAALWLGLTVLRGRRAYFAPGIATAGFVALFIVNVLNPDARIAEHHLGRRDAGQKWDFEYLMGLGADAAPVMLGRLESFDEEQKGRVLFRLVNRWAAGTEDWRTSSWSRGWAARWKDEHAELVKDVPVIQRDGQEGPFGAGGGEGRGGVDR